MRQQSSPPGRALLAAGTGSVATLLLGGAASGMVAEASGWASPDRLVAVAVVLVGLGAGVVLSTGCWLLAVAALAPRLRPALWCGRLGARLVPGALRRTIGLTVGAGIGVAMLGGIAVAAETDLGWEVTPGRSVSEARAPLDAPALPEPSGAPAEPEATDPPAEPDESAGPMPLEGQPAPAQRASGAQPEPPASVPGAPTTEQEPVVTVLPGDSLWRIAARDLGEASDAQIAAAWPRWYAANRAVIGPDPDLIHPGQVLTRPDAIEGAQ